MMVMSSSTSERNKTLMVLRFAYGIKHSSKLSRESRNIRGGGYNKSPKKSVNISHKPDKSTCNGKQHSLKDNETESSVQIQTNRARQSFAHVPSDDAMETGLSTNRTRHSITHASSVKKNIDNDLTSLKLNSDTVPGFNDNQAIKRDSINNGIIPKLSQIDRHGGENGTISVKAFEDHSTNTDLKVSENINNSARNEEEDKNSDDFNCTDIDTAIKEIESVPLGENATSQNQKDIIDTHANNAVKQQELLLDSEIRAEPLVVDKSALDTLDNKRGKSPLLSRLSTESRSSNVTSTSLNSNNSKTSRKSLADKIIEQRSDLKQTFSDASIHSLPASSESLDKFQNIYTASSKHEEANGISVNTHDAPKAGVKKTKHCPDLTAMEGENSQPIVRRRRRQRKILTAE